MSRFRHLTALGVAGVLAAGSAPFLAAGPAAAATAGSKSAATSTAATTSASALSAGRVGLARLLAAPATTGPVRAIATFDAVPSAAQADALRALGLTVQPMKHLPLALVVGPVATLAASAGTAGVLDVYPDDRLHYLDRTSSDAMGAASLRAAGLTGKGVTVAVVDSGCDATHPDLADHVVHNVKLVSPEYLNGQPDSSNTVVVPVEESPYQNSDIGSGHGTHVSGIIAADGTTDPEHVGVAPDANLVCYSIGEVLFTTAVVTAYDHLLDQPAMWGVRVVNNSWGNSYQQFDPRNPVATATKAVADAGAVVVFAAGNSGDGNGEGTLNPFSQSPWVLSVAAESVDGTRGSFSSNGVLYDNSQATSIGAGGHTQFVGNRVGLIHPDVTAPGVDISSTCDTAGTVVGPCPPGENTTASGTSMASPHVAGAAAVLLQANPKLTPQQVMMALQVTATPVQAVDASGDPTGQDAPFWQAGYGKVALDRAVALVRDPVALKGLAARQKALDTAVLRAGGSNVPRSDLFTYDAPRATLGTDTHTYSVTPVSQTRALRVTVVHPSEATVGADLGLFDYTVTVKDATGAVLGTTQHVGIGAEAVTVSLAGLSKQARRTITLEVVGDRALSDPDTLDSDSVLGDTVTVLAEQLAPLR